MKKIVQIFILLTLLIFGISNNSYSQYLKTLEENSKWYNYFHFELSFNYTSIISGDTVFNGKTYKKMVNQPVLILQIPKITFIREDTIKKTIYQYDGPTDILLYNFNLNIGDTFKTNNIDLDIVLDSITDTLYHIFGSKVSEFIIKSKKVFYFHYLNPANSGYIIWVEGIGSLAGIIKPNETPGEYLLLCHYNEKGIRDYHYIYDYEPQPCEGPVLGIKVFEKDIGFIIYPNPVTEIINIVLTKPLTGKLNISNNLGQVVKCNTFTEEQNLQVNLSYLIKGIYILNIITEKEMYIEKIIKE